MSFDGPTLSPDERLPQDLFEPLEPQRPPRSPLLSAILFALVVTYALGAAGFFAVWESVQQLAPAMPRPSLPIYGLVFVLGALSGVAVVKWKRWGVYGLAVTWAATAVLNAAFSQPVYLAAQALSVVLILAFFWQVRRIWSSLD